MDEDEFNQEIGAEFIEIGKGKVYRAHSEANQLLQNPFCPLGQDWSPHLPIILGCDFNVGLMCWELGQRRGTDFYYGDEIAIEDTDTAECAKIFVERVRGHKAGVEIIGDASGKSRKTSASGETDYTIITQALKDAGIPFRNLTPESNPNIKDRVNIMNGRLRSADGNHHLWYHPLRCKRLKADLQRVSWKKGADDAVFDKKDTELTHSSDAAGYPVCYYSKEFRKSPGTLSVIIR